MRLDEFPRRDSVTGSGPNVHARLVEIAEREAPSMALHSVARAIGEAVEADSCTIFLYSKSKQNGVVPRAHFGAPASASALELDRSVAATALHRLRSATIESGGSVVLAVPVAAINQAIGAIVIRRAATTPFTAQETVLVSGAAAQIVDLVEIARLDEELERSRADDR